MKKILQSPFFIRLLNWEYWPFHVVYAIIYPYWFWLCLKSQSLFFFSAANPSLENGGFLMESKKSIYDLIPEQYYPKTLLFTARTAPEDVWNEVKEASLNFPLIGKPDIGMRGIAVKKLSNNEEFYQYILSSKVAFLIQEYIPYEMEAGIFYYRLPNESKGHISGIVSKEFLTVKGDGTSTILELLQKDQRFILQIDELKEQFPDGLNEVLPDGARRLLVPYGNHCRGAKFIDASHMIDDQLTEVIDNACRQIDGFYYGRLDLRFKSWEELKQGKNFSFVELNGAGSEPTHIYDPKHSIFFAWKEIIRHLDLLYMISKQNRQRVRYMSFSAGLKMFRDNGAYMKLLNSPATDKPETGEQKLTEKASLSY